MYIFTSSYIFFSVKKVFFSKKNFNIIFFFLIETFFLAGLTLCHSLRPATLLNKRLWTGDLL